MSKKRPKHPFGVSPKTTEKYFDRLARAESDDTVIHSITEEKQIDLEATDSVVPDDKAFFKKRKKRDWWGIFKNIGVILGIISGIGFLVGIVLFFASLKSSVDLTKSGIDKIETEVRDFSKETRTQQEKISLFLVEVLGKFERLFDKLPERNSSNIMQPSMQNKKKKDQ